MRPIYPLSLIPFWSLAGSQEAAPDADHHRDWQGDPDGARKDDDPGEGPGGQDVSSASVIAQAVGLPKSSTQEHQVKRLREK